MRDTRLFHTHTQKKTDLETPVFVHLVLFDVGQLHANVFESAYFYFFNNFIELQLCFITQKYVFVLSVLKSTVLEF